MTIRIIALLLLFLPSLSVADDKRFTKAEVRTNVLKYINTVFGPTPPTIADRIRLEGGESMENDESVLAYEVCKHKFKETSLEDDKGCNDKFIKPRLFHPNKYESLYYKLLRNKLGVTADMLKIESIRFEEGVPEKFAGRFLITLNVENSSSPAGTAIIPKQLLLRHIENHEQVVEEGTVSVNAVVISIHDYVMPPQKTESTSK